MIILYVGWLVLSWMPHFRKLCDVLLLAQNGFQCLGWCQDDEVSRSTGQDDARMTAWKRVLGVHRFGHVSEVAGWWQDDWREKENISQDRTLFASSPFLAAWKKSMLGSPSTFFHREVSGRATVRQAKRHRSFIFGSVHYHEYYRLFNEIDSKNMNIRVVLFIFMYLIKCSRADLM